VSIDLLPGWSGPAFRGRSAIPVTPDRMAG
jgi:hypothetical protein